MSTTTPNPTSRLRNLFIALVATVLSVAIFLGFQTQNNATSLDAQAKNSTPFEVALSNGKPTLTEFYADWCTSCQAMAPDLAKLKEKYQNSLNFVMLNVDNNKWLPEVLRYRVDGIPSFVYFKGNGEAIAQSIGEQPLSIMEANLNALLDQNALPYAYAAGQTSTFNPPVNATTANPRSHGSQVKS